MTTENTLAKEILTQVGGKENLVSVTYCMTRLRMKLADKDKCNLSKLKELPGVLGVVESQDQLQVILGPGVVNEVAGCIGQWTNLQSCETQDIKSTLGNKKTNSLKTFLSKLANIFVPLIPAIVASGMIAGITNIAVHSGADPKSTTILILNALGWGVFSYLGIFVGINAAKEFGGTPAMGGLAGVLILNPAIANIQLHGAALVPGRGGLIGVLLVAWFMTMVEKFLRKWIPHFIDMAVTPALTLLITGICTYFALMPLAGLLSDGIVSFFTTMLHSGGALAGFVLAGTFLPVVITGLHQGLLPIHMELLNTLKVDPLFPILAMAGGGQIGATIAVYLKTRNQRLKNIIKGALPVAFLGIGEPLTFGVTLPLGRPFITACIGAGFGGAYQVLMNTSTIALGVSGLPLAFLVTKGSVLHYLIGMLIAYVAGFVITWFVGFDDLPQDHEFQERKI